MKFKNKYIIIPLGLKYRGRCPTGTITVNGGEMYQVFIKGREEPIAVVSKSKLPRIEEKLEGRVSVISEDKFREWEEGMEILYARN
ncbi:hypothetical protein GOV13_01530 [Candidatus Pacearchaeota archaeon]|nr:hypothetical protein [Candidatus Pacearchaeota archaeon]